MQRNPSIADGAKSPTHPLGFKEFVCLVAGLMATNALSIDPMLPALPAIGESLRVLDENARQWVITAYFMGLGLGSLFYGSISDHYGRRPVLIATLSLLLVATLFCAVAPTFTILLAGRAAAGFFAASSRVLAASIVRDRFHGDGMARVMSLVFVTFMIVPVLAPSFGQLVLLFAPWRWIFGILFIVSAAMLAWVAFRLPETLEPEHRVPFRPGDVGSTLRTVVTHRNAMGHMLASGVVMGSLLGFITSSQQIFFDVFHAPNAFPLAFAGIAGSMAVGSYFNSRLVERFGARRLSQTSLMMMILLSLIHSLVAWNGWETMASFIALQAMTMLSFAFTGANFNAISMEPFRRGAGLAASFQAGLTTILSATLGALTGALFNGTTLPMTLGFLSYGCLALLIVAWAEHWRLFSRPGRANMRQPGSSL